MFELKRTPRVAVYERPGQQGVLLTVMADGKRVWKKVEGNTLHPVSRPPSLYRSTSYRGMPSTWEAIIPASGLWGPSIAPEGELSPFVKQDCHFYGEIRWHWNWLGLCARFSCPHNHHFLKNSGNQQLYCVHCARQIESELVSFTQVLPNEGVVV